MWRIIFNQASRWQPEFVFNQRALNLVRDTHPDESSKEKVWVIETDNKRHSTKVIVIAVGIGAFQPIRLKNESVDRFEDKGVEYMVQNIEEYIGKSVLIVGGGVVQ